MTALSPPLTILPELQTFLVHRNRLSGQLPTMSNLPKLWQLWLHCNELSGPIPASFPGVTKLAVVARTVALSLFLSLVVAAAFVIHFATGWTTFEREDLEFGFAFLSSLLLLVWPASIPLSLALTLLRRRSRLSGYLCGGLLTPLSIAGFIVAGLLRSEVHVILVAALSLPAWIVLLVVTWRCSRTGSCVPA